ncbi:DUF3293 domain-containing protein [Neptunicella sp. SCSIO 80796]|uniref:DUF3293 domain-containing protein n=1 Tax=Neptunicella plasticusilytica TaxID=3117012 RepID=UPI003A4DC7EE
MANSNFPPQLVIAYQQAEYHVFDNNNSAFILKVGQFSQPLTKLYEMFDCDNATFITAFNPNSRPLTIAQNQQRQQLLIQDISNAACHFIHGAGRDPEGQWPAESSLLALGLDYSSSILLAEKFQQNAFLWCENNAIPELVWLI